MMIKTIENDDNADDEDDDNPAVSSDNEKLC